MTSPDALEKRIRRHVIGAPHPLFAVTAPGIEAICAAELAECLPGIHPRPVAGGVAFEARLDQAMQANLMLRTASRILMRIARFQAAHFAQLEKALTAVAWELYLARDTPVAVRVAARKSRLYHSEAIGERLAAAVASRRQNEAFKPSASSADTTAQMVLVRGSHDRFTVSLDTSGDLLHKRGLKPDVGPAPIRETLAAAILRLVGYTGATPLLDLMCGTGTFSLEAAMRACHIPAGWYRDFAFTRWPAFRPQRWAHLRRTCGNAMGGAARAPILAFDLDPVACQRVQTALDRGGLSASVTVACRDFFDIDPRTLNLSPGVAVINPPYGRRLGTVSRSHALFVRICDHLSRCYNGWTVAVIAPPGADGPAPPHLTPTRLHHGGLHLVLLTGVIGRRP